MGSVWSPRFTFTSIRGPARSNGAGSATARVAARHKHEAKRRRSVNLEAIDLILSTPDWLRSFRGILADNHEKLDAMAPNELPDNFPPPDIMDFVNSRQIKHL